MRLALYRKLLAFVRPHRGRMVLAISSSLVAATLDGYSFILLIPFLNRLFDQPSLPAQGGWLSRLLASTVGAYLSPSDPMGSLRNVILMLLGTVLVKNLFTWIAGTSSAQLQEYVTRDMRDAVYRHLQRLSLIHI